VNARAKGDVADGRAVDVVAVRVGPLARIAIGGPKQHQHFLALRDCRGPDLDLSRRGAEKRLHRSFKPHRLLERGAGLHRIRAQRRELIGIERELPHRGAEAMNGGVEAGAEQRPDQEFRLLPRHLARIRAGMDRGPNAVVRERLALALRRNPFDVRRHLRHRRSTQIVIGPEHVEDGRRIGGNRCSRP